MVAFAWIGQSQKVHDRRYENRMKVKSERFREDIFIFLRPQLQPGSRLKKL